MTGRRAGKVPAWYWKSDVSEKRITWVFPTEKAAIDYREQKWWKYAKFPLLENYLKDIPSSRKEIERRAWITHRDNYRDWILKKGVLTYDTSD